jgi:hypothetical protein
MISLAATAPAAHPSPLEVFVLRCWARASLFACGEISLQDAVDELQGYAETSPLILEIGQDAVQAIMASEFGQRRCAEPHRFEHGHEVP